MSGRKIILDTENVRAGGALHACPSCGAALSSVDDATLRPVALTLFRCGPGQQPRVFEARCGGCSRVLIVSKSEGALALAGASQDLLLKSLRESERAEVERGPRGRRER